MPVLRKVAAAVVLAVGVVGVWAAPAVADNHSPKVEAEVGLEVAVEAVPGVQVRTLDLTDDGDLCSFLSMILGFGADQD